MADLLQDWIGDDDGRARWELAQILHRVHVEINLIGNSEPHMGLCPPSHALDVEVVIDIYVVGGAVAAAGAASERKSGHQVVVNCAQRSDRPGRIHDDPPRVDHLAELADDLIVAREDDRRVSQPAGMVHVHAHLERLIDGFRSIDRQHREQLLDRQRMFAAHALNWRDQQLGVRLHRQDRRSGRYR